MSQIHVLDAETIDKIAAGEVVERPASVVKELVENAIDAGATSITVEIKDGGISFMRITDNGSGIAKDQIRTAFLRHATSKIETAEDLSRIASLGFRGEALSSISAVSQVELVTKTKDSLTGTRVIIEGGVEKAFEEVGAPDGTTFLIRNLFFNTPVRRKFLKQPATEGGYVADLMEHLALSRPDISFKFMMGSQTKFYTSGNGELKEVIYRIYGKDVATNLIPIDFEDNGLQIKGYLGSPALVRSNRNHEIYFLNGRFIRSSVLSKSIEEGYKEYLMQHKFPLCVLHMNVEDKSQVDVNVHPAKTEVRFFEEKKVFDAVYSAALNALTQDTRPKASFSTAKAFMPESIKGEQLKITETEIKQAKVGTESVKISEEPKEQNFTIVGKSFMKEQSFLAPAPETVVKEELKTKITLNSREAETLDFLKDEYVNKNEKQLNFSINNLSVASSTEKPETSEIVVVTEKTVEEIITTEEATSIPDFRIVGEAFKTYIFVELENKLLMIDKHAAHERMLFEKFKEQQESFQQMLLVPVTVSLSPDEYNAVLENTELLYKTGYEVSDFGDRCIKVSTCPTELVNEDISAIITEIASYLSTNAKTVIPEKLDWIYHSMACRAAIKAGNTTTDIEIEKFVKDLLSRENIRYCPHGRPVMVEISKRELEKQFKRIV